MEEEKIEKVPAEVAFTIPFAPVTAKRPRLGAGHARTPDDYRAYLKAVRAWLEDYLDQAVEKGNNPLYALTHLKYGAPIRVEEVKADKGKRPPLNPRFSGYYVHLTFVLKRPKTVRTAFPMAANSGDLDNYYKAAIDGIFGSIPFKSLGLDDRWIQGSSQIKRYTALGTDEKPRTEMIIKRLEV